LKRQSFSEFKIPFSGWYSRPFGKQNIYAITIRFQNKTALAFTLETAVFTFPVLSDWTSGDEEILKKYKAIRSRVHRT